MRAQPDDFIGRAFHHQPARLAVINQHRDAAPLEVEGHFVDFFPGANINVLMGKNGFIQRAFQAGLEKAVEIGQFQYPPAGLALRIHMLLQADFRLGQGAGLVGAQDIHRAKILNRGQALDDHVLFGHAQRAARQRDRDHHGQQFRRQPHGQRHGEQEGFQPGLVEIGVHQQHEHHHEDGQAHDQHAEMAGAKLERSRLRGPRNALGDGADGRIHTRLHYLHAGVAADD